MAIGVRVHTECHEIVRASTVYWYFPSVGSWGESSRLGWWSCLRHDHGMTLQHRNFWNGETEACDSLNLVGLRFLNNVISSYSSYIGFWSPIKTFPLGPIHLRWTIAQLLAILANLSRFNHPINLDLFLCWRVGSAKTQPSSSGK